MFNVSGKEAATKKKVCYQVGAPPEVEPYIMTMAFVCKKKDTRPPR